MFFFFLKRTFFSPKGKNHYFWLIPSLQVANPCYKETIFCGGSHSWRWNMQPGWKRFGSMGCPASTASGLVTCKVLHIDICTLDNELLDAPGISSDGSSMQPSLSSLVSLIYFIFGFGGRVRSSLLTNCRLRGMLWCCVNCTEERNSQEPQFKGSPTPLEGALATRFISSRVHHPPPPKRSPQGTERQLNLLKLM